MEWYNCFIFLCLFLISDSTCITPISNACSSTASQRSSVLITPTKSNTTTYLTPRSSLASDTLSESKTPEYFSLTSDSDDFNETVTNSSSQIGLVYETCIEASIRLAQATRSVRQRLRPFRRASTELLNRFPKLQRLSIVRASQISIRAEQNTKSEHCNCKDNLFDDNCLKTFMEMSVQPAEYRNTSQMMTSTPVITKDAYDHSIFNVARIKKVELHELSPKVPEFHSEFQLPFKRFEGLRFKSNQIKSICHIIKADLICIVNTHDLIIFLLLNISMCAYLIRQ